MPTQHCADTLVLELFIKPGRPSTPIQIMLNNLVHIIIAIIILALLPKLLYKSHSSTSTPFPSAPLAPALTTKSLPS